MQFVRSSDTDGPECRNSSVAEQQFCKLRVVGSIPTSGFPKKDERWAKTKYSNIRRYVPSGRYFAHAKVNGTLIRASLKTTSLEIAKLKLDRLLDKHRGRVKRKPGEDDSVGHFAELYLAGVRSSGIKERSKDYRVETWGMINRTWAALAKSSAGSITKNHCDQWAEIARAQYSDSRFNGCLETLRGIFNTAIKAGACLDDPTADIKRASIKIEAPKMPDAERFKAMLTSLDSHGQKLAAAFTVRLLAFTGLRINEARHLMREDVDLAKGQLTVRVTKNGDTRRVPIIEEARPVLQQFLQGAEVIDPRRALRTASGGTMTPHDLRHLFATRCMESGVDVRTIASWLGHRDGGALLLRRYAHLRDDHSQRMARKVRFG